MNSNSAWIACALMGAVLAGCRGPSGTEDDRVPSSVTAADMTQTPIATAAMVSHAAVGLVTAACPPNDLYAADGVKSLTDGRMGSENYYVQEWMGWWYEDKAFEATISLGKPVTVEELGVHVLTSAEFWIFYPRSIEFELSKDGKTYKKVATIAPTADDLTKEYPDTTTLKASNLNEEAQYVPVRIERYGPLPEWHMGYGGADGYEGEAWLFVDEILVNPR